MTKGPSAQSPWPHRPPPSRWLPADDDARFGMRWAEALRAKKMQGVRADGKADGPLARIDSWVVSSFVKKGKW